MTILHHFGPIFVLPLLVAVVALAEEPPESVARELLAEHNKEREGEDLPPLTLDETLSKAARLHAEEMAKRQEMTHEGADGSSPADRVRRAGYRAVKVAENVARGQRSVAEAMKSWMESEGHRRNILGECTQMGAAKALDDEGERYWCVVFGSPRIRLDPDAAEAAVAAEVAEARAKAGKAALKVDPKLAKVARSLAAEMASSAAKPEGERKPPDVAAALKAAGARDRSAVVLLGGGEATAKEFVSAMLEDPARKEPLMGEYEAVGTGYATDSGDVPFWCVVLVEP